MKLNNFWRSLYACPEISQEGRKEGQVFLKKSCKIFSRSSSLFNKPCLTFYWTKLSLFYTLVSLPLIGCITWRHHHASLVCIWWLVGRVIEIYWAAYSWGLRYVHRWSTETYSEKTKENWKHGKMKLFVNIIIQGLFGAIGTKTREISLAQALN